MNIGHNLKKRRLTLGYTLEEVAKKVGTSKQTIHRYETGIIANIPSVKIEALSKSIANNTGLPYGLGKSARRGHIQIQKHNSYA